MLFIQLIFTLFWASLTTPTSVVESPQIGFYTEGASFLTVDDASANFPFLAANRSEDSDDDMEDDSDDSDDDDCGASDNFLTEYDPSFDLTDDDWRLAFVR